MGSVLLYSIDLSQRTYDVMHLRGYEGRLAVAPRTKPAGSRRRDITLVAAAACSSFVAVAWRLAGAAIAPWAWMPLLAGVAALVVGLIIRTSRPKDAS